MNRRSLIFRTVCSLLGLSGLRIEADQAVAAALPVEKDLNWTVWLTNGETIKVKAVKAIHLPGPTEFPRLASLQFLNSKGAVVAEFYKSAIRGCGVACPPVKVEFGYKQEFRSIWAPIKPAA